MTRSAASSPLRSRSSRHSASAEHRCRAAASTCCTASPTPGGELRPVGHDSVHLANAIPSQAPTWQFAVITNANINLQLIQPMNGQTRRARSILSWAFTPTDCNFTPIWGNALNYRIRLDQ